LGRKSKGCNVIDVANAEGNSVTVSSTWSDLDLKMSPLKGWAPNWPGNCWASKSDVKAWYQLTLAKETDIS